MIKFFDNFEYNRDLTGIVGIPSGEYLELDDFQIRKLVLSDIVKYDANYKFLTFNDKDYYKIISEISGDNNIKTKNFLKLIGLNNYKINDDGTVDAIDSVKIKIKMKKLPIQFDYVMGNFDISDCGLETLKGCPDTIEGNFICSDNNLDSLEYGPLKVNGNYDARQSGLKSLKGSPMRIKKNFYCSYNSINNLEGGPRIVDGSYYVDNCLLTSLKGSPDLLTGNFDCSYNLLETLEDGPDLMSGNYNCSNNNLKTLRWGPGSVGGVFKCNGNKNLRSFSHAPMASKIISDEI